VSVVPGTIRSGGGNFDMTERRASQDLRSSLARKWPVAEFPDDFNENSLGRKLD